MVQDTTDIFSHPNFGVTKPDQLFCLESKGESNSFILWSFALKPSQKLQHQNRISENCVSKQLQLRVMALGTKNSTDLSLLVIFHDLITEFYCTLMNFLAGSGLLSVIFMMTPLVNWGPWVVAFSLLSLFSAKERKKNTNQHYCIKQNRTNLGSSVERLADFSVHITEGLAWALYTDSMVRQERRSFTLDAWGNSGYPLKYRGISTPAPSKASWGSPKPTRILSEVTTYHSITADRITFHCGCTRYDYTWQINLIDKNAAES